MRYHFAIVTDLPQPPTTLWPSITTLGGINDELAPWLQVRSASPQGQPPAPTARSSLGRPPARQWVWLLGIVPIGSVVPMVHRLDPTWGFIDESTMPWLRAWRHERHLEALATGCRLTDHIVFTPHYAWMGPWLHAAILYLFRHRHRRRLQQAVRGKLYPSTATMLADRHDTGI